MRASRVTPARRLGQVVTGLGALIVLLILIAGAPVALIAFAGNPLPDQVPSLADIGSALTSRDDGQLFLRALAVVGWLGWATFLLSVLVEIPAQLVRRPAPKLPGLGRQQRVAAALIGSISLILVASPAAAFAAPGPAEAATVLVASSGFGAAPEHAAPASGPLNSNQLTPNQLTGAATQTASAGQAASVAAGPLVSPTALAALAAAPSGADQTGADQAGADQTGADQTDQPPVYQVAKGDYLGHIADRYLGEFGDYQQLAALNDLDDPDRIRAGQLLRLPTEATDSGVRAHASGVVLPAPDRPAPQTPPPVEQPAPAAPQTEAPPAAEAPEAPAERPAWQVDNDRPGNLGGGVSAGRSGPEQNLNRPLAVAAVITAASIVGAQIGTVLGLKRRTAGTPTDSGRHRRYRD
ncbi:LysM peptidoglycan-binding domain-containing protein [Micromonospora sp. NBC_01813]|uniref:LysM peptidoglycan-binding domain-containing protein n=1 Tax=Micromonospora sp. NBC_01813 TaxID=2975988 RepID=UPI002DD9D6EB|nr:LysM domain-containing protein [Micromonospora sp. NBC_01813]WSA07683.1 LysM peptidoglycan-binding domain-containing protein [Micromonospora sp. NBC_01813]